MKKMVTICVVLMILVVGAAIIIPHFIDLNNYKGQITAAVKQRTGRDMKIEGKIELSLFPNIALKVDKVSLSSVKGATYPQMVVLDELILKLQLLPLLKEQIIVDSFALVKPIIYLEVNKQGVPNWQFPDTSTESLGGKPVSDSDIEDSPSLLSQKRSFFSEAYAASAENQKKTASTEINKSKLPANIRLSGMEISHGELVYLNHQTGQKYQLSDINVACNLSHPDKPVKLKGDAKWREERITLEVVADNLHTLTEHQPTQMAVNMNASLFSFSSKGMFTTTDTVTKGNTALKLKVDSLPKLLQWMDVKTSTPVKGGLTFDSNVSVAPKKLVFSNMVFTADELTTSGNLTVLTSGNVPSISGSLKANTLDLRPYMKEANANLSGSGLIADAEAASGSGAWSDEPIDLSGLKAINLALDVNVDTVRLPQITIDSTLANLKLYNGVLNLILKEMTLYEGKVSGTITLQDNAGGASTQGDVILDKVEMASLLAEMAHYHAFKGATSGKVHFTARGVSSRALVQTLNGQGNIRVDNGELRHRNAASLLRAAQAGSPTAIVQGDDVIRFSRMDGTYIIQNGVIHNNDLTIISPSLRMAGNGIIDLPHMYINYRLKPTLLKTTQGTDTIPAEVSRVGSLPLLVEGSLTQPALRLDTAAAVEGLLKDPAKTVERLQNLKSGIKDKEGLKNLEQKGLEQLQNLLQGR